MIKRSLLLASLLYLTAPAQADWTLHNESSALNFVSIKAGSIAEIHSFTKMEGTISDSGAVALKIPTASVETLIPIRNERMREMLFESGLFPTATFMAQLDAEQTQATAIGTPISMEVSGTLTVREATLPITATLQVTRLADDQLMVATIAPIVLNAAQLGLANGLEKLREVAGLPSISQAVPVTLSLIFRR